MAPLHCAICNSVLTGRYLGDDWGNAYCVSHQGEYASCAYCARFLTKQNMAAHGDIAHCTVCDSTAITRSEQAEAAFWRVRDWLHRQGVIIRGAALSFRLVSYHELKAMVRAEGGLSFGTTATRVAGNRVQAITVSILRGLPATLFQGACAHELGHAWLQENAIRGLPLIDEEGFCEFLAWRYYDSLKTPEGRYHTARIGESPHPIYGAGFRKVHALAIRHGFGQLVNQIAYHHRLPSA